MPLPSHHRDDGRFQNPWPVAAEDEGLRRRVWRLAFDWLVGRRLGRLPPDPEPGAIPETRAVPARPCLPDADPPGSDGTSSSAIRAQVTWLGHASCLVQLPGLNLLTDPVFSRRCSPVGFMGPARFVDAPLTVEELPPIHAVLLSHDHYDHLDRDTVDALHRRFGEGLLWFTPLGYRRWFASRGITRVVERDWWDEATLPGGAYRAVCTPARHWTRRRPFGANTRLWCGWAVLPVGEVGEAPGARVWFVGDSGACPAFHEIGQRLGPFDISLVPIGAYEPRWFMAAAHMNPEEAVETYVAGGGRGAFVGIHWGTWRLTFEDPLEPPVRVDSAWAREGLPQEDLHVLPHGGAVVWPTGSRPRKGASGGPGGDS